jgi:hypothetical protein
MEPVGRSACWLVGWLVGCLVEDYTVMNHVNLRQLPMKYCRNN